MNNAFNPKFFSLFKTGLSRKQLFQDSIAGVIVGIVALPLAIAFAVASGVSPEKGLTTAIIAGFIISFLGGSRVQIGGPTGAFVVIVFGIIAQYGYDGLVISTILAGIMLVAFGLMKLGSLLKFIPQPMIIGFTSGIALVIFSTQIKDAFGLQIDKVPSEFLHKWMSYSQGFETMNIKALIITVVTILITVFFKKITTKIPGSFIAIILITTVVRVFNLEVSTIETVFGEIPRGFQIHKIHFEITDIGLYIAPAITIALLGGIESLLSAVVADGMISGNHRSNTELIAQGIANIVTPIFGGIPATGAIARTATNVKNGGRTPVAGMVHALVLLLIMVFFGSLAKLIPMSCLAGILIVVAYNMSEWRSFVSIFGASFFDVIILLTTFILTVFVDLTVAIEVGIILSALLFMKRMADIGQKLPNEIDSDIIDKYSDLPEGVRIYEISGPFFFGSAKHYTETIEFVGLQTMVLIIRMRHVPFIDATGCHNLKSVIQSLQHQGTKVMLSGVNEQVMNELNKSRIAFLVGMANVFPKFDLAVSAAIDFVNNHKTNED